MDLSNTSASDKLENEDGIPLHLRFMWLGLGLVALILNMVAAFALYKSEKINLQIRLFSIQLTYIEIIGGGFIVIIQIFRVANVHVPCRWRWYVHWVVFLTRGLTVAFLSLDRLLCIYFAMKYAQYVSRRLVIAVCLSAWAFSIIVCTQMFMAVPDSEQYHCEGVQKMKSIEGATVIFLVCIITVISSYIGIYINVKLHERELRIFAYKSTLKILAIVIGFLITILPGFVYNFYIWIYPEMIYKTNTLRILSYVFVCIGSIATPFLYVLRFQDCRIQLTKACCCLCKSVQDENERQLKIIAAPYLNGLPNNSIEPRNT